MNHLNWYSIIKITCMRISLLHVDKNMATTVTSQPYNVILAGPFGVGKTFIFDQLREETIRYPTQKKNSEKRLDKWIHSARCGVDEIKVIKVGG